MTAIIIVAVIGFPHLFAGWMAWLRYKEKQLAQQRRVDGQQ